MGIHIDAALPVMRRYRRLHQIFGKAQSELAEALAIGRIGFDLARVAMVEPGEVAAVVARLAGMHLPGQRLELNRVRSVREGIVLLLVEEFFARRIYHAG